MPGFQPGIFYHFLNLVLEVNNHFNKEETPKLIIAPIVAITMVKITSFKLILKTVDSNVPPITPDLISRLFIVIRFTFIFIV